MVTKRGKKIWNFDPKQRQHLVYMVTVSIESPADTKVILPLLMIVALFWAIRKCLVLKKVECGDPICAQYTDSLPPLGKRPFTGPELAHRHTQEVIKELSSMWLQLPGSRQDHLNCPAALTSRNSYER
ncbi:hypothetical protein FAGAP_2277 [Fusarium agapanthi]|uniref:Uncharacterized protein n=1 Tax=Fusarium agapanthi TaxID=1803897 RepID=A0A9P5BMP9_9HYPO|nr:hypothetical protein FAGAP_2277 [Fusarium agapanthi]